MKKNDTAPNDFKIRPTLGRGVKIKGWLMGSASSKDYNTTRWHEKNIYLTSSGTIVVVSSDITLWQGETDDVSYDIFLSESDLIDSLGDDLDEVYREAMDRAEIDYSLRVP